MAVLGGTIGAILAGSITEKLGRKSSIILTDCLLALGALLLVVTHNITLYAVWRFIIGFGMGTNMMVSQVFMCESSPLKLRGTIQSFYILGCFSGFICSHLSSLTFAYNLPMMFGIGIFPAVSQMVLMISTQDDSPI